jgi:hypothetical protein
VLLVDVELDEDEVDGEVVVVAGVSSHAISVISTVVVAVTSDRSGVAASVTVMAKAAAVGIPSLDRYVHRLTSAGTPKPGTPIIPVNSVLFGSWLLNEGSTPWTRAVQSTDAAEPSKLPVTG